MSPDREIIEFDVLVVGGGPAGLATAYHLRQLLDRSGRKDASIAVLEKGAEIGSHIISGAVFDPRGMDELMPDWLAKGAPVEIKVEEDHVYYLTRNRKLGLPIIPPPLRNAGNYIISLNKFIRWLAGLVEESGVDLFAGFSGSDLLIESGQVVGVRTGDKGVDRQGQAKGNYEPGIDILASLTVLAEGARGSLTKQIVKGFGLDAGRNSQVYSVGVKEVWDVPRQEAHVGRVIHTMGFPLSSKEFGGGFIYNMDRGQVSLGLVVGLDYEDPRLDPHRKFQQFKQHPLVRAALEGGRLVAYGAKAIPEGGYWAMPQCYFPGGMVVGDSGGFLNSMRLKGIHLALKSGMLAAEAALEAIQSNDFSASRMQRFEVLVEGSWIKDELWKVRNFHQGFRKGLWRGMLHAGLGMITRGRGVRSRYGNEPGHTRLRKLSEHPATDDPNSELKFDQALTFDKLTDVYNSGTAHEEDQPVHLVVLEPDLCHTRCTEEYGNPCQYFCPAAVYSMEANEAGQSRLAIDASNCVHCKSCDIMDPYQIINWIPPEGGGGPGYKNL
jgi:electron-transferring-flavoprotein dehydrogenase